MGIMKVLACTTVLFALLQVGGYAISGDQYSDPIYGVNGQNPTEKGLPDLRRSEVQPDPTYEGDMATFSVEYKNADGRAPAVAYLWMKGPTLHKMASVDTSFFSFKEFKCSVPVSVGNLEYHFQFIDDDGEVARLPTDGYYSLEVRPLEPEITIYRPNLSDGQVDNLFEIQWTATNVSTVDLYYDVDFDQEEKWLIVQDAANDGQYVWDVSNIPNGAYTIFGVANNHGDIDEDYGSGRVVVNHDMNAPRKFTNHFVVSATGVSPKLVVDQNDPRNVHMVWSQSGDVIYASSSNSGETWDTPVQWALGPVLFPEIAFDQVTRTIHGTWATATEGVHIRSVDGGNTWSAPSYFGSRVEHTVEISAHNGRASMVWLSWSPGYGIIKSRCSSNDGDSWAGDVVLYDFGDDADSKYDVVNFGPSSASVMYRGDVEPEDEYVHFKYSSNGGCSWSEERNPVDPDNKNPANLMIAAQGNRIYMLFRDDATFVCYSENGGSSWSTPVVVPIPAYPTSSICASESYVGVAYVEQGEVGFIQSDDDGQTWGEISILTSTGLDVSPSISSWDDEFMVAYQESGVGIVVKKTDPFGPQVEISPAPVVFESVSLGDTVSVPVTFRNTTQSPITLTSISLPSPEMRTEADFPRVLEAGERDSLVLYLEPRTHHSASGNMVFRGDEQVEIESSTVVADIKPLGARSRSSFGMAPFAQPLSIQVEPLFGSKIERGKLHYRTQGSPHFQSAPLEPQGPLWAAEIPSREVSYQGVQYYIEVENSGVFAYDPPGAPGDSLLFQPVADPVVLVAYPIPNSESGYRESLPLEFRISLWDNSDYLGGYLNFRKTGETEYQSKIMTLQNSVFSASVPGLALGPRGLEYWISAYTNDGLLTDPPIDPILSPRFLAVTFENSTDGTVLPDRNYRMISFPVEFGNNNWTVADILSGQPGFGPYDPTQWRCFRYDSALNGMESGGYVEYSERAQEDFILRPGFAYWLVCAQTVVVGTGTAVGASTLPDSGELVLKSGWNQVGNPFAFPVCWDSVLVDGMTIIGADTLLNGPIPWVPGVGYGEPASVLKPFEGYWVQNLGDGDILLRIPAREAPVATKKNGSEPGGAWALNIAASTAGAADLHNIVGVHPEAQPWFDRYDRAEAPPSPGPSLAVYFPHGEWRHHGARYTVDFRPEHDEANGDWGHSFNFDVAKRFTGDDNAVTLTFSGLERVQADATITLVDHHLSKTIDLRRTATYTFPLGRREPVSTASEARFALLVGSAAFVEDELPSPPDRTALFQNYPNPFNPSTLIRFDVALPGRVSLRIYDLSGALVRTLFDDHAEPGGFEVPWFGRSDTGRRMASGVYFSRLQTESGFVETRKLLMVQ